MIRTEYILKNTTSAIAAQLIIAIIRFVVRSIFIASLGVIYLGYISVFSNIMAILNFAELGISIAITSLLYKAIASGDFASITALTYLFKKAYRIIAIIIAGIGIIIAFVLPIIINDAPHDISYIIFIYIISLTGTVIPYFFTHKSMLLYAHQKNYISLWISTFCIIGATAIQIPLLLFYPNFTIYMIISVIQQILIVIICASISSKNYPFINNKPNLELVSKYKIKVKEFVKNIFLSQFGAYIFYGTDNIIISAFLGIRPVALYANYTMVVMVVQTTVNRIYYSIQASIGNYIHTSDSSEKNENLLKTYLMSSYLFGNFCMMCIAFLVQPFISIWLSSEYLLSWMVSIMLGINLLMQIILSVFGQFFTIYGLFKYDRKIVAVSAVLNIFISILFVKWIGICGVLIGTFVASQIYLFSRAYIIFKYIFKKSSRRINIRVISFYFTSAITFTCVYFITSLIPDGEIISFICKILAVSIMAVIIPVILFLKTSEMKYIMTWIRNVFKKVFKKN